MRLVLGILVHRPADAIAVLLHMQSAIADGRCSSSYPLIAPRGMLWTCRRRRRQRLDWIAAHRAPFTTEPGAAGISAATSPGRSAGITTADIAGIAASVTSATDVVTLLIALVIWHGWHLANRAKSAPAIRRSIGAQHGRNAERMAFDAP